jgi:hypothetical protein
VTSFSTQHHQQQQNANVTSVMYNGAVVDIVQTMQLLQRMQNDAAIAQQSQITIEAELSMFS